MKQKASRKKSKSSVSSKVKNVQSNFDPLIIWYKELGFEENPLSIKPAFYSNDLEGYKFIIDELESHIQNNKIVVIEGDYGTGKTSILKFIINHYKGNKKVCYLSCNRISQEFDIDSLLMGRYGAIGKLFGIKGKDMVLLLDEAYELSKKDFDKIKSRLKTHIKAVLLTTDNSNRLSMDLDKNDNDLRFISLLDLPDESAVAMIRKRIGNLEIVGDDILAYIFNRSGRNPREFLENCEDILKFAVERKIKRIQSKHVDLALTSEIINSE